MLLYFDLEVTQQFKNAKDFYTNHTQDNENSMIGNSIYKINKLPGSDVNYNTNRRIYTPLSRISHNKSISHRKRKL